MVAEKRGSLMHTETMTDAELAEILSAEVTRILRQQEATIAFLESRVARLEALEAQIKRQLEETQHTATVKSAISLTREEQTALREHLRDMFGEYFDLHLTVDPSLIGGLVVEVKGQVIDGSVAGKLEALREHLFSSFFEEERR